MHELGSCAIDHKYALCTNSHDILPNQGKHTMSSANNSQQEVLQEQEVSTCVYAPRHAMWYPTVTYDVMSIQTIYIHNSTCSTSKIELATNITLWWEHHLNLITIVSEEPLTKTLAQEAGTPTILALSRRHFFKSFLATNFYYLQAIQTELCRHTNSHIHFDKN